MIEQIPQPCGHTAQAGNEQFQVMKYRITIVVFRRFFASLNEALASGFLQDEPSWMMFK